MLDRAESDGRRSATASSALRTWRVDDRVVTAGGPESAGEFGEAVATLLAG